ncbi:MAG TPA: Smr/MutS family protein [Gemmatimonadales bacterium]|nr:Smr/MutS family protein [Gemmatimonadales bacterium]
MPRRRPRQPQFDASDPLLDGPATTLDLHGDTVAAARTRVAQFLAATARRQPGSRVHIITGRGRGSSDGPRLRPAVAALLKGECARWVKTWDRDVDDGGFVVLLH